MDSFKALKIVECIRRIKDGSMAIDCPSFDAACVDALDTAELALRKQIPRHADVQDVYDRDRLCPICGNPVERAYCAWCGQRIDYGVYADSDADRSADRAAVRQCGDCRA